MISSKKMNGLIQRYRRSINSPYHWKDYFKLNDTGEPFEYSWDTTTVSNGTHNLRVNATDNAGNSKASTISVTVRN